MTRALALAITLVSACGDAGDPSGSDSDATDSDATATDTTGESTGTATTGDAGTGLEGCGPWDIEAACRDFCQPWLACTDNYADEDACVAECMDERGNAALAGEACFTAMILRDCCVAPLDCDAFAAWAGGQADGPCRDEEASVASECA